ncbi:MAG: type II toxin-antitoxin system HipA family toxin YjjJ [Chthoniobacterales bacterium]|nr:type II toxin-antitoxin system HipA family toxin YjjJ [Chthoniobacterales bacterium]
MTIEELIRREFLYHGVRSASQLATELQISQPTLSRKLSKMGDSLLRIGKGKSVLYALKRTVDSFGSSWPIFEIQESGKHQQIGQLTALHAKKWHIETDWHSLKGDDFRNGIFPGVPWFLDDVRPQGFLGRAFARTHGPSMGLQGDPSRWPSDAILEVFLRFGSDLPGAFVVGEEALAMALKTSHEVSPVLYEQRASEYLRLADAAMGGFLPGSSAGGEQPKFTALVEEEGGSLRHVMVKFSGSKERPEEERWADLLAAEQIAFTLLAEEGLAVGKATVMDIDGRRFLTIDRFDRVGPGGRRAMVSLLALDSAFFGQAYTSWNDAADRLEKAAWISPEDASLIRLLWHFGSLIGNNDMHYGNLSFLIQKNIPLTLAPSYDMLPMALRPSLQGQLSSTMNREHHADCPHRALELAECFWERVAASPLISEGFRKICCSR